jgi:lipopolysaccharide biosynthesis glycosyltransferase
MDVVYFCSDFFSEMCGVSIESLFENNKDVAGIHCYIVESGITEENQRKLLETAKNHCRKITFIKKPDQHEVFPDITQNMGNAFARMAIGELLPQNVNRVLALDCDTLVLDSLKEMYESKFLENEYVAGVYDCIGAAYQKKVLKAPDDMKYCNAGVFLIDLQKWRELNVKEQLLQEYKRGIGAKPFFLEQDLMNRIFYKHIKLLPLRYNIITSLNFFEYDEVIFMKHPICFYSEQEYYAAREKPAIIHAATCFYIQKRMWVSGSDHPHSKTYMEYRARTAWRSQPLIKDQRSLAKKIYAKFWHIIPRRAAITICSFLINYIRPLYVKISEKFSFDIVANRSTT